MTNENKLFPSNDAKDETGWRNNVVEGQFDTDEKLK